MKKLLLTTATLLAFHTTPVLGATETFTASVEFVQPLTLTENQALDFGLVTGASGTVSTGGVVTGGATIVQAGNPALIDVAGTDNKICDVTVTPNVILTNAQGFQMYATLSSAPTVTLNATGTASLQVNGVVALGSAPKEGLYQGTYDVTVLYQ